MSRKQRDLEREVPDLHLAEMASASDDADRPEGKEEAMTTHSLFEEDWWLESVAPGRWGAAEVRRGEELVARLPYVTKTRSWLPIITSPPLTPTLGPWIKESQSKYANRLGEEKDLIEALLAQLPPHVYCSIPCHPRMTNLMPFHWAGFELQLRYTYRLNDLTDLDRVQSGFLSNVRGYIRKAEKTLAVRDDLGLETFLDVNELTFRRQGRSFPYSRELVRRLDQALAERGQRRMLFAVDSQERIPWVTYLVWDRRAAYYLMSGGDTELRTSGANSLLLWRAIQHAATVSQVFDFEGSMIEPVERFVRAFGAQQTPYYRAVWTHPLLNGLLAARQVLHRRAA